MRRPFVWLRKALAALVAVFAFCGTARAVPVAWFTSSSYSAGTMLTATAWFGPNGGYWTDIFQNTSVPIPISNFATWGTNAITINTSSAGWTSSGNSKTAYTYTDFYSRMALGDQNWMWVRWDGTYGAATTYLPHNAYYFRVYASGANWTAGKSANAYPTDVTSGALTGVTATDFTMRMVANGSSISCFVNGTQVGSFSDSGFASGSVGITESNPGTGKFDLLVVDDGTTPTPSNWQWDYFP